LIACGVFEEPVGRTPTALNRHLVPAFIMIDTLSIVMAGLVPAIHAFDIHK